MPSTNLVWGLLFSVQKVFQHLVAVLGEDRLRVKLHPLHIEIAMAHPHDFVNAAKVFRPSSDFETGWQAWASTLLK